MTPTERHNRSRLRVRHDVQAATDLHDSWETGTLAPQKTWPDAPALTLRLGDRARVGGRFAGVLEIQADAPPAGVWVRLSCCERVVTRLEEHRGFAFTDWTLWEQGAPLDPVPSLHGSVFAPVEIDLAGAAGRARAGTVGHGEKVRREVGARGVVWFLDVQIDGAPAARFQVPVQAEGAYGPTGSAAEDELEDLEEYALDDGAPRLDPSRATKRAPLHELAEAGIVLQRQPDRIRVVLDPKRNRGALVPLGVFMLIALAFAWAGFGTMEGGGLFGALFSLLWMAGPLVIAVLLGVLIVLVISSQQSLEADAEQIVVRSDVLRWSHAVAYRWDEISSLTVLAGEKTQPRASGSGQQHLLCARLSPGAEPREMSAGNDSGPPGLRPSSVSTLPEGYHCLWSFRSEHPARWLRDQVAAYSPFPEDRPADEA